MNKMIKMLMKIMPIMLVFVVCATSVFGLSATLPTAGTGITKVDTLANNIWGTVQTILQMVAFAAIIIAGIRYMFASAEQKADIKGQTVILVVGAIIVFAAPSIITFIQKILEDTLK